MTLASMTPSISPFFWRPRVLPYPPLFLLLALDPPSREECSPPGEGLHHRLGTFCDVFVLGFSKYGWLLPRVLGHSSPFELRFPDPLGAGHVFRAATRGSLPGSWWKWRTGGLSCGSLDMVLGWAPKRIMIILSRSAFGECCGGAKNSPTRKQTASYLHMLWLGLP